MRAALTHHNQASSVGSALLGCSRPSGRRRARHANCVPVLIPAPTHSPSASLTDIQSSEVMKRFFCLLLITTLALNAQGKKKGGGKKADNPEGPVMVNLGEAKLAADTPGERVSEVEKQSDWPAVAATADGSLYAIYVVWN